MMNKKMMICLLVVGMPFLSQGKEEAIKTAAPTQAPAKTKTQVKKEKLLPPPIEERSVEFARTLLEPLKSGLMQALQKALAEGGPEKAIEVCQVQAPELAKASSTHDLSVGRTTTKLRNQANAAEPWMKPLLAKLAKAKPAEGAPPPFEVVRLSADEIGYMEAIHAKAMCLTCHGAKVEKNLLNVIKEKYPHDKAIGYKEGDFRGAFWVKFKE